MNTNAIVPRHILAYQRSREMYNKDTFYAVLFVIGDYCEWEGNLQVWDVVQLIVFVVYGTFRMGNRRSCGE